jgi:hypothetical protein
MIPQRDRRTGRFVKPPVEPMLTRAVPQLASSWPHFAFLIAAAVIWYFLKWPIIVFGRKLAISSRRAPVRRGMDRSA